MYRETVRHGEPDASVLLRVETNVRRNFSRIMLKTSVKYGNREKKRKRRGTENQEYLNRIWDYAGARLRDVVKSLYRFPTPSTITLSNGDSKRGYPGSAKNPIYPLGHNHLPELDFGDMIRSHLIELGRQCLKYSVPVRAAKRYNDELIERLIPFMDYVYTERRTGRSAFIREGLTELREIVKRIRVQYGIRNGRPLSVTGTVSEELREAHSARVESSQEYPDDCVEDSVDVVDDDVGSDMIDELEDDVSIDVTTENLFDVLLEEAAAREIEEWKDLIATLRNHITKGVVTADDAREILKSAVEESRRIGSAFHDFISYRFPTAARLSAVVYHGRELAYDKSGLLLISELNIAGGLGRPDLVLLGNKTLHRIDESPPKSVFAPCMVVELKTRSSFDLDVYGTESKSEEEENTVGEFILERRRMSDSEWERVLSGVPSEMTTAQVNAYSRTILDEYHQVMWRDTTPPEGLVQAVVVVDSKEDWGKMRDALLPLVLDAYDRAVNESLSEGDLLQPKVDDHHLKMALCVVSSGEFPSEPERITGLERFNPFWRRNERDGREFILYLTVSGRGSPAQSAASIAERWHGLQYLYDMAHYKHRDIVWLDLSGEYSDKILTRQRFWLTRHSDSVKRFFKNRVRMTDISSMVQGFLHQGGTLKDIGERIQAQLSSCRKPIIVVSGWASVWRSTPDSLIGTLSELVRCILSEAPKGGTILWFGRPVPVGKKSSIYETRCVAPFYSNTHWQNFVDRIVWNKPWPPPRAGSRAPADDHMRILTEEIPGKKCPEPVPIVIDPLEGWGEAFRPRKRERIYSKGIGTAVGSCRLLTERDIISAIGLIAHLQKEPPDDMTPTLDDYQIEKVEAPVDSTRDPGLLGRITFKPYQYLNDIEADGRVKRLLPLEEIDRRREYREMELGAEEQKSSTRPPSEAYLVPISIDDRIIALSELCAMRRVLQYLSMELEENNDWTGLVKRLLEIVNTDKENVLDSELLNRLRLVRQALENNALSRSLWKRIWPLRSRIPSSLRSEQRKHLGTLMQKQPDLLSITGNHLFLLILAALGECEHTTYTKTLENLWEYVRPWHLMGLGLKPKYPEKHNTGISVLHRRKVLAHLRSRASGLNVILDRREVLSDVKFGELIKPKKSRSTQSVLLWLVFQSRPGSYRMNAAMLQPRGANPELAPQELLRFLVSGKTFWTESDISKLSSYARPQGDEERMPVIIARYKGVQALWVLDRERGLWSPVGRIDFTTRQFEDVTLVRTLTIRSDQSIQSIPMSHIQYLDASVRDDIHSALSIIWVGLGGCVHVQCHVSLNFEENMYSVAFVDSNSKPNDDSSRLLVNRTVDLLEILRRPDNECEPVIVDGKKMIWNRFRDIRYSGDTRLIRPWVERRTPFGQLSMGFPPTAHDLMMAEPGVEFELIPYHDPWTCPLRNMSLEDIRRERKNVGQWRSDYLLRFETPLGQPKRIFNESGLGHGSCWRVRVSSVHDLPTDLTELNGVRMTDSQLASLLECGELTYWSEERMCWMTHSFEVVTGEKFMIEGQESWHLKRMFERAHDVKKALIIPGSYLDPAEDWTPYFNIEPEYVLVGLKLKGVGECREMRLNETAVALRSVDGVTKLLSTTMDEILDQYTMSPGRKLQAAIRQELKETLDEAGVTDDEVALLLAKVSIRKDSSGGECLFAVLQREDGSEYPQQLTGHIHSLTMGEPLTEEQIDSWVRYELGSLSMSEEDKARAVRECVDLLENKGFMKESREREDDEGCPIIGYPQSAVEREILLLKAIAEWRAEIQQEPRQTWSLCRQLNGLAKLYIAHGHSSEAERVLDESISWLDGITDDVGEERTVLALCEALALNVEILMDRKGNSHDEERLTGVVMRLMELFKGLDVGTPSDYRRKTVVHNIKRALDRFHRHD